MTFTHIEISKMMDKPVKDLTLAELAAEYNFYAGENKLPEVKRFSTREAGERRLKDFRKKYNKMEEFHAKVAARAKIVKPAKLSPKLKAETMKGIARAKKLSVTAMKQAAKKEPQAEKTSRPRKEIFFPATAKAAPARAGTKIAIVLDLIKRKSGASPEEIAAAISKKGTVYGPERVRGWIRWDIHTIKGYGAEQLKNGNIRLILPKGLTAMLPHLPRKDV